MLNLEEIYKIFLISDLTVVDYGSSVLEAIYLKKKIIFYKWEKENIF